MASVIDICNLALAHLGDKATVSAISPPDGTVQAEHCARFYPIARGVLLETHPWHFATRRTTLKEISTTELPGSWTYAYSLPNLCIKPQAVLLSESTDDTLTQDYELETLSNGSSVIFTNVEDAVLKYTVSVTDTTKYPQLVVQAVARLLSSYLAGPIIKGKVGMGVAKEQLEQYLRVDLPLAKSADAMSRKSSKLKDFIPSHLAARV